MEKSGAHDIASSNRQLVVKTLLAKGPLSRIELSNQTHLSTSTVSRLVGNLLTRGILAEDISHVQTAGRSRIPLIFNPLYGKIIIVKILLHEVVLNAYDMSLKLCDSEQFIRDGYSSKKLFEKLISISTRLAGCKNQIGSKLKYVGLLFCDGILSSKFDVNRTSRLVSLRAALTAQLGVSVLEERDETLVIRENIICYDIKNNINYALVSLDSSVIVTVMMNGNPIVLHDGLYADMTSLIGSPYKVDDASGYSLGHRIMNLAALLFSLFPIDRVFVTSRSPQIFSYLCSQEFLNENAFKSASDFCNQSDLPKLPINDSQVAFIKPVLADADSFMADLVREAALEEGVL